jgi:hypothetical protein
MPLLDKALGASDHDTAYYDTGNHSILVEKRLAPRQPERATRYLVRMQHRPGMPLSRYLAATVEEALAWMRTLKIDDFDPDGEGWQPAMSDTTRQDTTWSGDASTRGLPPMEAPNRERASEQVREIGPTIRGTDAKGVAPCHC